MGNMVFWSGVLPIYILFADSLSNGINGQYDILQKKYNTDLESLDECVNTLS